MGQICTIILVMSSLLCLHLKCCTERLFTQHSNENAYLPASAHREWQVCEIAAIRLPSGLCLSCAHVHRFHAIREQNGGSGDKLMGILLDNANGQISRICYMRKMRSDP